MRWISHCLVNQLPSEDILVVSYLLLEQTFPRWIVLCVHLFIFSWSISIFQWITYSYPLPVIEVYFWSVNSYRAIMIGLIKIILRRFCTKLLKVYLQGPRVQKMREILSSFILYHLVLFYNELCYFCNLKKYIGKQLTATNVWPGFSWL